MDDQGRQAEIGWAIPKVAVIADGGRGMRRSVRRGRVGRAGAGDWPPEELAARIMGGDR